MSMSMSMSRVKVNVKMDHILTFLIHCHIRMSYGKRIPPSLSNFNKLNLVQWKLAFKVVPTSEIDSVLWPDMKYCLLMVNNAFHSKE